MGDSLDLSRNEALLEPGDLINNECAPLFPLEWPKYMHKHVHIHSFHFYVMSSSQHDQIVAGQVAFIVFCEVIEVAISYVIRFQTQI